MPHLRRLALAASALVTGLLLTLVPTAANAHSLNSSTIAVTVTDDSASATVSLPLETLDAVLGTDYASASELSDADIDAIVAYLDEHLTVTGSDGTTWTETYTDATRADVEGVDSLSVDIVFDTGDSDTSSFSIEYDAIVEGDSTHEAVVVLTDANGDISTAGVLDSSDSTLQIGDAVEPGLLDMIGYGFHHVLEGADHLLFLTMLLLVAPLVAVAGRWRPREGVARSARGVVGVATAFAIGHSLTLIASALGWISLPTVLIEILVAASVAVSAIHAIRPLVRHGEEIIAAGFGLVHGLAFAGILSDLGLDGSLSILTLLAFNVGVELAQLLTIALVFPSIYLLSRTRFFPAIRIGIAGVALLAAAFWILDRAGLLANPLADAEDAGVAASWLVALVFGVVAIACRLVEHRLSRASREFAGAVP